MDCISVYFIVTICSFNTWGIRNVVSSLGNWRCNTDIDKQYFIKSEDLVTVMKWLIQDVDGDNSAFPSSWTQEMVEDWKSCCGSILPYSPVREVDSWNRTCWRTSRACLSTAEDLLRQICRCPALFYLGTCHGAPRRRMSIARVVVLVLHRMHLKERND